MNMPFIDLKTPYLNDKDEFLKAIESVLNSTEFIMGKEIGVLENALAKYCDTKHAIACSSGTDALLLSLMALDIGPEDEIITTPFTFIASAEVISFLKAKPVFVDIKEDDYTLDPNKLKRAITPKTKAIMPVSLYGQCADMDEINEIADKKSIPVIEDGAQSFGAEYKGKKSLSLSTIGCTSFFPSKPLGCYGDGGALLLNDDKLAKKIKMLLNHGQESRYRHEYIGINGRLDTIQAAILNVKLKRFKKELKKRNEVAKRYDKALSALCITPKVNEHKTSVYAQYSIRVKDRDRVIKHLNEKKIPTAIHYPIPLHLQPAFFYLGYKKGDFPVSEQISSEILSLPMSPYLKKEDQEQIIASLKEVL